MSLSRSKPRPRSSHVWLDLSKANNLAFSWKVECVKIIILCDWTRITTNIVLVNVIVWVSVESKFPCALALENHSLCLVQWSYGPTILPWSYHLHTSHRSSSQSCRTTAGMKLLPHYMWFNSMMPHYPFNDIHVLCTNISLHLTIIWAVSVAGFVRKLLHSLEADGGQTWQGG